MKKDIQTTKKDSSAFTSRILREKQEKLNRALFLLKFNEKEKNKCIAFCDELRGEVKESLEELQMENAQGDGISVTMASRVSITLPESANELIKRIRERAEASGKCEVSSKKYIRVDMK